MQREDPAPEAPPRSQQAKRTLGEGVGGSLPALFEGPLWNSFQTEMVPSMTLLCLKLEVVLWEKNT